MNTTSYPNILLFNSIVAEEQFRGLPGVHEWSKTRKIWGHNGCMIDRTGVIQLPFKTEFLDSMRVPEIPKQFSKTLEQCCVEHARSIVDQANATNQTISILWSGGIDSTCTVSSFLMCATFEERKRITILLNRESILENTNFYENHLLGKLACKSSNNWESYIKTNNIFVTGEGGDQVCWNGFTRASDTIFNTLGWNILKQSANPDIMIKILEMVSFDKESAKIGYERVLEPLRQNSVVPVDTVGQLLWYFNFVAKWQNVYLRILLNLVDTSVISTSYIETNFKMFFQSKDIQIWTMLNNESTVWVNKFTDIKMPLKNIIFQYDKDEYYKKNKVKIGSLGRLSRMRPSIGYIKSNWEFSQTVDIEHYYNNRNSFI
jgi:hypothetical protein